MSSYISEALRRRVINRADNRCEYCLVHQDDILFTFHVDHVISEKHGGPTNFDNLALACNFCNWQKGSDIATINPINQQLVRLYNPRQDNWATHFRVDSETGLIEPLSEIGEATIRILNFNHPGQLLERQGLIEMGHYPLSNP